MCDHLKNSYTPVTLLLYASRMSVMLFSWQQQLMTRLSAPDLSVSCWYVAPQTGLGKTWMAHHLSDVCGALNTYPFADTMPLTHTIQAVKHYINDNCSCGNSGFHRFENRLPGEPIQQASPQKIVVFDMHTGCKLRHRLKRLCPCLASSHVIVFTDYPPDKETRTLRAWEIVNL
jgi:hypothetical protein